MDFFAILIKKTLEAVAVERTQGENGKVAAKRLL
jgi:hypothetical protein